MPVRRKNIVIVRPIERIVDGEKKRVGEQEIARCAALIVPISSRETETLMGVYGVVSHRAVIQPPPSGWVVKVNDEVVLNNKRFRVVAVSLYDIGSVLDRMELLLEAIE
jgi:hypothetical protein